MYKRQGTPDKLPLLTPDITIPTTISVRSSITTVVELVTAPLTVSVVVKYQYLSVIFLKSPVNRKPNPPASVDAFTISQLKSKLSTLVDPPVDVDVGKVA